MRWVIWALAAFFYFYEYLLRVSPSAMVPELMNAFNVNAGALGVLSAFYFYAYAPMQLPVGILMDRFGARKLLTLASIVCALGAILFGISRYLSIAYIGRLLIGLGSSFAFVAMVYVCSHWFEKSKRALLVGLANSIGMLGAVCGAGPLSLAVHSIGWRLSLIVLGFVGIGLAFVIFLTIFKKNVEFDDSLFKKEAKSDDSLASDPKTTDSLFLGIRTFCKNSQSWLNALTALLFYMTTTAFGGLWGISFIQKSYGASKSVAGFAMSMLFFGWLVGGPLIGTFSDRLGNRKRMLVLNIFLALACLLPVIYLTSMPIFLLYILIFGIGFFSSAQLLNFTFATEINPPHMKGTSIACTNFLVAVGSSFIQPLIGVFLDINRTNKALSDQFAQFSTSDYKIALSILPLTMVLAWIFSFFLKEKSRHEF